MPRPVTFLFRARPSLYSNGNCLNLRVDHAGRERWILRTVVQGKHRDIGLGSFTRVSLVEARAKAQALRKIAREGGDPFAARGGGVQHSSP